VKINNDDGGETTIETNIFLIGFGLGFPNDFFKFLGFFGFRFFKPAISQASDFGYRREE